MRLWKWDLYFIIKVCQNKVNFIISYLQSKNAKMANSNPRVPQTTPAMTPICSSRSFKNMECSPFIIEPPIPEDDLGAKVRIASHPGCKSILLFLENSPKCIFLFPTTDLVPAWILRSYIVFVVKLFKYILKWKMKSCKNYIKRIYLSFSVEIGNSY